MTIRVISPENAHNKLLEFAVQAGATEDKLKHPIHRSQNSGFGAAKHGGRQSRGRHQHAHQFVVFRRRVSPKQEVLEQYYRGMR
jgi:hypothetical protein